MNIKNNKMRYYTCLSLLILTPLRNFASEQLAQSPTQKHTQSQTASTQQPGYVANNLIVILDAEASEAEEIKKIIHDIEARETESEPEKINRQTGAAIGAMTGTFISALQAKAAPIVVTKEVIENFCFLTEFIGEENLKKMREASGWDPTIINEIFESFLDEKKYEIISKNDLEIISKINLDNKNWHGYIHNTQNLVLLIPQAYIANNKQGEIKNCGFALDSLTKIPDLSPKALAPFLAAREAKLTVTDEFINAFKSLFIQDRVTPWNIYLTGHGAPAEKINKSKLLSDIKYLISSIRDKQTELNQIIQKSPKSFEKIQEIKREEMREKNESWRKFIESTQIETRELQKDPLETTEEFEERILKTQFKNRLYQDALKKSERDEKTDIEYTKKDLKAVIEEMQNTIKEYQTKLTKAQTTLQKIERMHLADGDIVPGIIAGLDFNHFVTLMNFFENNIKTSFLYYTTCFGGGANQALVNEELKKLNVSFIVVSEGISETSTYGALTIDPYFAGNWIFSALRFNIFFKLLNEFFGNFKKTKTFTQAKILLGGTTTGKNIWRKDPIKAIIQSVNAEDELVSIFNTPFIRFPSIGVFNAIGIDEKVKILTNSIVRAHELEGEPIDLSGTPFENIIVYPRRIGVPLNMGEISPEPSHQKALILPTPTEFSQNYKAIAIFEKIIFEQSLQSFLYNIVVNNTSKFDKIFLVKNLECRNYEASGLTVGQNEKIAITNLIALLSPDESNENLTGHLDVCFEFNGHVYCGTMDIPNFDIPYTKAHIGFFDSIFPVGWMKNEAVYDLYKSFETFPISEHIADFERNELLFHLFKSFKVLPADRKSIQNLAQKLVASTTLKQQPIPSAIVTQLAPQTETNAILAQLAQELDNSVEKIVVEPGALKRVLTKQREAQKINPRNN